MSVAGCNAGDAARGAPAGRGAARGGCDGGGERCLSDSESGCKTRYINPAICVETVEASHSVTSLHGDCYCDDVTPHPHSTYRSNSTPLLSGRESSLSSGSIKRKSCRLQRESPRDRTYREDGADTFRLSVASLSTTTTAKNERDRHEKKRQDAFEQWVARKEAEKREKLRLQKTKSQPIPVPTAEQREESFRRWVERKRLQTERRRAEDIVRAYRAAERADVDRVNRRKEKEEKLSEWAKKKEDDLKQLKSREERRAARASLEEERRRANGERAYRDWLRTSKNKPLPVPLNQGELSMRGSVSQMYINPVPWQSLT